MVESKYPNININKITVKEFWKRFEAMVNLIAFSVTGDLNLSSMEVKEIEMQNFIDIFKARGEW